MNIFLNHFFKTNHNFIRKIKIVDSNNIKSITVTEDSKHTFTCELEAKDNFKNETVLWRWTKNNKILDNNNTKNFSLIVGKLDACFYTCQPYLNNLTRIVINIDSKRIFKLQVNSKSLVFVCLFI